MSRLPLILALSLPLVGCDKKATTKPEVVTDASIATSLWQRMAAEQYSIAGGEWRMFPGKSGIYSPDTSLLGSDPHLGPTHFRTFANAAARGALTAGTFPLPDGSIIAKENYVVSGPDTTLAAITVMFKRAGYDVEHGDWFWTKFQPDGRVDVAGKVTMCIGCHQGASTKYASNRDYVWTKVE